MLTCDENKNRTSQLMAMKPHRLQNELVIPGQVEYRPAGTRVAQLSKILIANWNLGDLKNASWALVTGITNHEVIRGDAK